MLGSALTTLSCHGVGVSPRLMDRVRGVLLAAPRSSPLQELVSFVRDSLTRSDMQESTDEKKTPDLSIRGFVVPS
jgi:hypothetical protein